MSNRLYSGLLSLGRRTFTEKMGTMEPQRSPRPRKKEDSHGHIYILLCSLGGPAAHRWVYKGGAAAFAQPTIKTPGRIASNLDAVAKHLGVAADAQFVRQARNLASKSGYERARDIIEGRRSRTGR